MSFTKLVLKGTGRMSLHERFTQLKFDQKNQTQSFSRETPRIAPPRTSHSASRSYEYSAPPRSRTPDMPRYSARRRSMSPAPIPRRPPSVRNQSAPNRSQYSSKSSTLLAANRIKKKSVYLRLGVRPGAGGPRMSSGIPVWSEPYSIRKNRFNRPMSRSNSTNSLNRWNSQSSINSYDTPRYQNNRRYRGGGRGGRRNYSFNRTWRFGRNRFTGGGGGWGRGRYRGRGRGRGRGRKPPPPNREQLDQELDSYMAGTRGILDKDLDTYMENKG